MKYFIKTFGCQMNYSDSERIAGFLSAKKYREMGKMEDAELVIFNTCGIRQAAEDRALSIINTLRKKYPDIKIVITGCLANRKDVQKKLKNKVDLFFPTNNINLFKNFIIRNCLEIKNSKLKIAARDSRATSKENIAYLSHKPKYSNKLQASVPIMTGCNNFCSYCVVPYARGQEISRPAEEIICEIKKLVKNGCKEITLLGQNVNSYNSRINTNAKSEFNSGVPELNSDFTDFININFSKLLQLIEKIPGKFWIRFASSHPKDFSDELIETVAQSKKVCEHIHLPIQAGSDEILQKMNRKYTAKHYFKLIGKIRSAFKKYKPGVLRSITSDIIVGFPAETKKQFLESAKIMEKAKFDLVYFGQFSPRPETAAWKMKDNVSKKEKTRREKFLNEILKKTSFENNKKYINTAQEVLIDRVKFDKSNHAAKKEMVYFGKTRSGKNVKVISNKKDLIGKFVKVKITKANIWNLEGELGK